jgi:Flp pilus assembly protein TadD
MLAAVFPISCTVMTAVTDRLPGPLALLFGMAFFVGLKRIVSRPIELNCDYLAARAVGFRATSSALAKIHAVHPISNSGLLALLLYAAASHPSRDARLAALYDASPAEDRPTHRVNLPMVQTSGRVAYGALIVWILVLTATFVLAGRDRVEPWLAALLLITACSPFALLLMGIRKQVRRQSRRMGRRWGLLSKVVGGTIGGSVAILLFTMIGVTVANRFEIEVVDPTVVIAVVSCAVVLVSMMINLVNGAQRKLQQAVNVALQLHDFARARELCLASPQIVSKSHMLRYQLAIADAVCGNRQAAMESLEQLWQDKPHFPLPALALAELQLDANEAERTVELARTVERLLPHDTTVALLEGRALRRLGLTEESQITCHTAQAMEPEDGSLRALAAGLELDLGQFDQSRRLIEQALEQVPGDAYALVIRAEIEIATAPLESAQQAVSEAKDAIHTNPLIFLQFEVNRLQTLLAAAENRQTVPPNR